MDNPDNCRRMWCAVVLTVLNDSWHQVRHAKGDAMKIAKIRGDALRYFDSRDGRAVLGLAGITASADQLADAAVDLAARDRTLIDKTAGWS